MTSHSVCVCACVGTYLVETISWNVLEVAWKVGTNISQIITLLHVSTLSCHPQGACNQYLAKLHKISNAAVGNTIYI
jgi:hypothetical protein